MRSSMDLRLFSLFIMKSSIKSRDLFPFFVMRSPLNSGFDVLCVKIEYPYARTWKDAMFDGMKRNALCEGTCDPMIWDEMPCAKEFVTRWYETKCLVRRDLIRYFVVVFEKRMRCSMIWDGMFYAKGLVTRWYGTKCPMRRDLWLDGMGRNALCVGICEWDVRWYGTECSVRRDLKEWDVRWYGTECPVWRDLKEWNVRWYETECPVWRDLIRYFLYLNCDNPTRRKLRVKKNGLSQCNNDI